MGNSRCPRKTASILKKTFFHFFTPVGDNQCIMLDLFEIFYLIHSLDLGCEIPASHKLPGVMTSW